MFEIKDLNIGDRVAVFYHERSYSSVVQDIPQPDTLIIAQPTILGVYLDLVPPDDGEVIYYRENGLFSFRVVQEGCFVAKGVPMLKLRAVSGVKRNQRRSLYRLEKSLPIQVSSIPVTDSDGEAFTIHARTINISGSGCRVAVKQPVEYGTRLECTITLGPNLNITLGGRIVWLERLAGSEKTSIIGVQFDDENPAAKRQLFNYVMDEQRKQLQKNR